MTAHVDRVITSGTFSLDGGTWDVDNNVWIVGDGPVTVIDPAHDPQAILAALDGRRVERILLTHGHDDHIRSAAEFADLCGAPIHLHPADRMLWDAVYPDRVPDAELADGQEFELPGGTILRVLHTPGHTPGSVCFYVPVKESMVFTGDTLFAGGPGATGRSYSDFPTIINSIRSRLLTLPARTVVLTGHGETTLIGTESRHLQEWIAGAN